MLVDSLCRQPLSTILVDSPCRQLLSTALADSPCRHPCRQPLSTALVDNPCRQPLSTILVNSPCGLPGGSPRKLPERALRESSPRELSERALRERALRERAFRERALREKALREKALRERELSERELSERESSPRQSSPTSTWAVDKSSQKNNQGDTFLQIACPGHIPPLGGRKSYDRGAQKQHARDGEHNISKTHLFKSYTPLYAPGKDFHIFWQLLQQTCIYTFSKIDEFIALFFEVYFKCTLLCLSDFCLSCDQ